MTRRCARWCGRGCTQEEYEAARDGAKALAKNLGPGWRPRVWENMGWHYKAVSPCRRVAVYFEPRRGRFAEHYNALFGDANGEGGRYVADGRTPRAALRNVTREAIADMTRYLATFAELPRYQGRPIDV